MAKSKEIESIAEQIRPAIIEFLKDCPYPTCEIQLFDHPFSAEIRCRKAGNLYTTMHDSNRIVVIIPDSYIPKSPDAADLLSVRTAESIVCSANKRGIYNAADMAQANTASRIEAIAKHIKDSVANFIADEKHQATTWFNYIGHRFDLMIQLTAPDRKTDTFTHRAIGCASLVTINIDPIDLIHLYGIPIVELSEEIAQRAINCVKAGIIEISQKANPMTFLDLLDDDDCVELISNSGRAFHFAKELSPMNNVQCGAISDD